MAKKFRPTAGQQHLLNALAACLCAQQIEKNMPEMKGYFDFLLKENPDIKAVWDAFGESTKKTYKDLADRLTREGFK